MILFLSCNGEGNSNEKEAFHTPAVGSGYQSGLTQTTFAFARLYGQFVPLRGVSASYITLRGEREAFSGASIALHLWH
jgi:hypothetical protein